MPGEKAARPRRCAVAGAGVLGACVVRGLHDADVAGYRVCVRPMPADGQSIVGWLPGAGGLYMAVTHSGVTLAAHLAQLITAELVSGAPAAELAPYRPDRFMTTPAPESGRYAS